MEVARQEEDYLSCQLRESSPAESFRHVEVTPEPHSQLSCAFPLKYFSACALRSSAPFHEGLYALSSHFID